MKTIAEASALFQRFLMSENKQFSFLKELSDENQSFFIKDMISSNYIFFFSIMIKKNLYTAGGWLELKQIEEILQPLLIKYGFQKKILVGERTIIQPIVSNQESDEKYQEAINIQLISESEIKKSASLIWQYIDGVFIPFWEKYSDLQTVNNEIIDKIPDNQITDYIPRYASFKKMIIMKLCNNQKYNDYHDWLYQGLKKRNNEGKNQDYYQLMVELSDLLSKI